MGEVYRARDPRLEREVALKLLRDPIAADGRRLQRFEQEARAAGQLNHPNILTVHDVGTHAGALFVVSELLEGETLGARLRRGAVPPARAADVARQIAEGLAAAHDKGIVHRDIKPDNVFITKDGRVKILDFGIAKLTQPDADAQRGRETSTETEPGVVIGTSGYMSPEQVRGERVDARSDIFSLGAVLHEMLTGRPAFARATTAETMAAILKDEASPLGGDVPALLTPIVVRCLEKTREARFQSARDLAFALEHLPAFPSAAFRPPAKSGRQRVMIGSAVAGAIAIAAVAAVWFTYRPTTSIEDLFANARFTRFTDWPGTEAHAAISADGRFVAFLADRDGPFDLWVSQVGTGRFQNLTAGAIGLPAPGPPLRLVAFSADGSEIWVGAPPRTGLIPLTGGTARPFLAARSAGAAWSPDGTRVAFFKDTEGDPLFVSDQTGADARQIFGGEQSGVHTHNPVWSPDGQWIYFVHGRSGGAGFDMDIWRVRPSGESSEQLTHVNTALDFIAPIGDRTLLYVARAPDRTGPWLWALDIPNRTTRRLVSGLDQYRSVSASHDGRRIVATVANPTTSLAAVRLLDRVAEEGDIEPYTQVAAPARMPRFGRTSLFYVSGGGADEGLWRMKDGRAVEVWKGSDGTLLAPAAVSPDENQVAVVVRRAGKPQLSIMAADGTDVRALATSFVPAGTVDWSPDGEWIVAGGTNTGGPGMFKIAVRDGTAIRLVEGEAVNPIWSPDGNLIVYNGPSDSGMSTLLAVRPDGGRAPMPQVKVRPGGQRFLPNGRGVVYQSARLDFHLLDLVSGATRQLTGFNFKTPLMAGRTFDISADGTHIVFDRSRENSDIVLIEMPK